MAARNFTRTGNAVGVILPEEALARLKLAKGAMVLPADAVDGPSVSPCSDGRNGPDTQRTRSSWS